MATREEIADAMAGMALFADLARPQLSASPSRFEEAFFPKGERILRQGLTGSGFYVILDGEAAVVVDGEERATARPGRLLRRGLVLLGEPPWRTSWPRGRCAASSSAARRSSRFLVDHPQVMYRMLQAQARRLRNANRG